MTEPNPPPGVRIVDVPSHQASLDEYDLGIWAAGYEARSSWLVKSTFVPRSVSKWIRVEFLEHREEHSGPVNLTGERLGELLANQPGHQNWDGHWEAEWEKLLTGTSMEKGRKLRVYCDYSSMPRTVYGTLVRAALTSCRDSVESLTLAYVPGVHGRNIDGSRAIEGLRALIGTEGRTTQDSSPAFILGLGYDGVLAESVLELFQVSSFGCVYADPGVYADSVARALKANAQVLRRAEIVAKAPAWSIHEALLAFERIRGWFVGRDTILVPLGPKPHVLASILLAVVDESLALRFPQTSRVNPVEVTVAPDAVPYTSRVRLET